MNIENYPYFFKPSCTEYMPTKDLIHKNAINSYIFFE